MNHSNNRVRGVKNQTAPRDVRSAASAAFELAPTIDGDVIIRIDHITAYNRSKMHQGGDMMIIVDAIDHDEDQLR
jgi:hypothetical protein